MYNLGLILQNSTELAEAVRVGISSWWYSMWYFDKISRKYSSQTLFGTTNELSGVHLRQLALLICLTDAGQAAV